MSIGVDRLGEQLDDDADVEEDEGHDAGQGADAHRGHEDERVEEVRDGSDHAEDGASQAQTEAAGRRDPGGEEGDGEREPAAEEGGYDGHLERLDERLDGPRQERPVRVQELADDLRTPPDVGDEGAGVEADAELRAHREQRDDDEDDDAERQQGGVSGPGRPAAGRRQALTRRGPAPRLP